MVEAEDVSEFGAPSRGGRVELGPEGVLWEASLRGEAIARESLAAVIEREVTRHLARLGARRQERDDLVAEVQAQVLDWLAKGRERPRNLHAFLRYRALGAFTAHLRRRRARREELDPAAALAFFAPEDKGHTLRIDLALDIEECTRRLPAEQRELIEARYARSHTLAEVARSRGRALVWVHRTLQRALEALRRCLEGGGRSQ